MIGREPTAQAADANGSETGWKGRRAENSGPAVKWWSITAGEKRWADSTDIKQAATTTTSMGADVACMPHDKHKCIPRNTAHLAPTQCDRRG
mmetsp:Transcript_7912/g.28160  ORF Transcript_7912/g.28160 Transcript_7912/m.28160 type:complete len:92 (-) Transcript_7912:215-490(-)|eukprot:CAMPEP_0113930238 /NCGR_PEP_ID=MMETSP1159-20121227/5824_1 /TAXON_ID=88271 /ORGANISM="Picocystis salinarum" /LENGTH=91 /DNA_ID=CAMNT_0000930969 /DNA_START=66 /DNA_END=341 /DNA_ORIENTATION=- /assembly_acc=CAM_ASM_000767